MSASARALELTALAAEAAAEVKATDPVAFDVTSIMPLADVFLVLSGSNERQVAAIAERIEKDLAPHGARVARAEGVREGRWALLDFNEIIVHVMHQEDRAYYELERLWKDCPVVPTPSADEPSLR